MNFYVLCIIFSLCAFTQANVNIKGEIAQLSSIVNGVVNQMLENLRQQAANIHFDDVNETLSAPNFNMSIQAQNLTLTKVETFKTERMDTSLIPITIHNLTLTWEQICFDFLYNVNGSVDIEDLVSITEVYGDGKGRVTLNGVTFTIGANLALSGGSIQILPKGLFNFNVKVNTADVYLEKLMGRDDIAKFVGAFLSNAIPKIIDTLKEPIFMATMDDVIVILNNILAGK